MKAKKGYIDTELLLFWWMVFGAVVYIAIVSIFGFFTGWSIRDNYYTGYIYTVSTAFDRTIAKLRFSENAGEDKQPSFCVYGEEAKKAIKLAGSGIKVRVHEKETAFHFKSFLGCNADTEIEILEDTNETTQQ